MKEVRVKKEEKAKREEMKNRGKGDKEKKEMRR